MYVRCLLVKVYDTELELSSEFAFHESYLLICPLSNEIV
ncbi:hypothetical protein BSIN_4616 [Burkholderia singularis]|uniref:Uncharacterized protein n=1 Tax=Burkholderia singularis TaxID=1503053 RepID=A0A238H9K5_9BURK|nr:hypothetical protein BSIN_4616 [Burkholderia singularis]